MRLSVLIAALALAIPCFAGHPVVPGNEIRLASGTITTVQDFSDESLSRISSQDLFDDRYYRIIQFNSIPDPIQKRQLETAGLRFVSYLPANAWLVSLPRSVDSRLLTKTNVRTVLPVDERYKLNRRVAEGSFPDHAIRTGGRVELQLSFFPDVSFEHATAVLQQNGARITAAQSGFGLVNVEFPKEDINRLVRLPFVRYIEPVAPASYPEDSRGRSLHRSNYINSDIPSGLHYNGNGVAISLADDGEVGPHIDFQGRITQLMNSGAGGTHGDMTSGIAVGAGNLDPTIRGMADGARIYIHDIGAGSVGYDHIYQAPHYLDSLGAIITSTSYSQGCNDYNAISQTGDQIVNDNPSLTLVFSAGNNAQGDCGYGAGTPWGTITGGFKIGKNVIAVGNLDAYEVIDPSSSHGPADDGRVKPDICANGRDQLSTDENNTYQVGGGTSAACPSVAGTTAQLYQAYRELNSGSDPESPLIKATLLNTAEDIGNDGPDYSYGYGRINARRALQTLANRTYVLDSVGQGSSRNISITVPSGVRQLRVLLYWLDPAGDPSAAFQLVNDLDLTLSHASIGILQPWILDPTPNASTIGLPAVRGADHLNNVEQVTLDNPSTGTFTASVSGNAVPSGMQKFYVVWEFRTDEIVLTYPTGGEGFAIGSEELLRWDAYGVSTPFTLEFSPDNGANWQPIATVGPDIRQYAWTPIASQRSGEALVRITRGSDSDLSDETFTVSGIPQNLHVDFACPDTMQIGWNTVTGATAYEVSVLGSRYMDSVMTVTGTTAQLAIPATNEVWFSVRALVGNGKGRRANAVQKAPGLVSCSLADDIGLSTMIFPVEGNLYPCFPLNSVPVTVEIRNDGLNTASGFQLSYTINGGSPVTETYTGSLIHGATTNFTFAVPADFSAGGAFNLVVTVNATPDLNLANNELDINLQVVAAGAAAPLQEAFAPAFPPAGWDVIASGPDYEWSVKTNITGSDGSNTDAAWFDNYSYNNSGALDYLVTILVDFAAVAYPQLLFDVAYAQFSGYEDGLRIEQSADCGATWTATGYEKIGAALASVPSSNTDWSPSSGNDWRNDTVELTSLAGELALIRFVNINDFGNNLYIDNINLQNNNVLSSGVPVRIPALAIFPNPGTGVYTVDLRDLPLGSVQLTLTDVSGRLIESRNLMNNGRVTEQLNLLNEPVGVYILQVRTAEKVYSMRLTKI